MNNLFLWTTQETNEHAAVKNQQGPQPGEATKHGEVVTAIVASAPNEDQPSLDKQELQNTPAASTAEEVKLDDLLL